jgi:hypothetical protein
MSRYPEAACPELLRKRFQVTVTAKELQCGRLTGFSNPEGKIAGSFSNCQNRHTCKGGFNSPQRSSGNTIDAGNCRHGHYAGNCLNRIYTRKNRSERSSGNASDNGPDCLCRQRLCLDKRDYLQVDS